MNRAMRFGVILPGGTAVEQLAQAELAERSGWDAVFVYEAGYGVDAWSLLAAMAARTERVRLGTMLTPLPFRRPWKVASQAATLDQLSGGRAVLTLGVGALDTALPQTGEVTDLRQRAAMLDEGIDLMRELWRGGRKYTGEHYRYETDGTHLNEAVHPVQDPIPIWVVGVFPKPKSMRRVLRCEGVVPGHPGGPAELAGMTAWLAERDATPDVVVEGETAADGGWATVEPWAAAGATWWLEARWQAPGEIRDRIAAGPPRPPAA